MLRLKRGHWQIEHLLHRSKDVTFGKDASLIHVRQAPVILAQRRDTADSLLRAAGHHASTARLRYHRQHPEAALTLALAGAAYDA